MNIRTDRYSPGFLKIIGDRDGRYQPQSGVNPEIAATMHPLPEERAR
jgi:hypothetical protein